jgi:hypothetical protein
VRRGRVLQAEHLGEAAHHRVPIQALESQTYPSLDNKGELERQ